MRLTRYAAKTPRALRDDAGAKLPPAGFDFPDIIDEFIAFATDAGSRSGRFDYTVSLEPFRMSPPIRKGNRLALPAIRELEALAVPASGSYYSPVDLLHLSAFQLLRSQTN